MAELYILTVNVEVHPQPHGVMKEPRRPQLLQNKTILFLALNGQDVWSVDWKVTVAQQTHDYFKGIVYISLPFTFLILDTTIVFLQQLWSYSQQNVSLA